MRFFSLQNQAPQPAEKWDGEFYAVKDGPICVQRDPFRRDNEIEGSEDCLQLNVYAPYSVRKQLFFYSLATTIESV